MKLIIVSGPSGSGKTRLSKRILKKLKHGIILNTDNYYKTGIISQLLSKILTCYFDRQISFNYKLFKNDLEFILKNRYSNFSYEYDFKSKSTKKQYKNIKNIKVIILEGIFVQAIFKLLKSSNCILINLKTNKKSCMKRVIKRDFIERGKNKNHAKKDFIKSWELFYKNKMTNNSKNYLKTITLKKKSDINSLPKKITKLLN